MSGLNERVKRIEAGMEILLKAHLEVQKDDLIQLEGLNRKDYEVSLPVGLAKADIDETEALLRQITEGRRA